MKKIATMTLLGLIAIYHSNAAYAGPGTLGCPSTTCTLPLGANTLTQHKIYAGFVWKLQSSKMSWPNAQLGFQALNIHSTNTVNGLDLSIQANIHHHLYLDNTKLVYVAGSNRTFQGNFGLGYTFKQHSLLGTTAIQAAHLRVGTDYLFKQHTFNPYFEGNTLTKNPSTSMSCAAGTGVLDAFGVYAPENATKDSKTCFSLQTDG